MDKRGPWHSFEAHMRICDICIHNERRSNILNVIEKREPSRFECTLIMFQIRMLYINARDIMQICSPHRTKVYIWAGFTIHRHMSSGSWTEKLPLRNVWDPQEEIGLALSKLFADAVNVCIDYQASNNDDTSSKKICVSLFPVNKTLIHWQYLSPALCHDEVGDRWCQCIVVSKVTKGFHSFFPDDDVMMIARRNKVQYHWDLLSSFQLGWDNEAWLYFIKIYNFHPNDMPRSITQVYYESRNELKSIQLKHLSILTEN